MTAGRIDTDGEGSPDVGELLDLLAALDRENEHLRQRLLEFSRWMEDAVTAQVATERRSADLERQIGALDAEIDAIHGTITWRTIQPLRRAYGRLRRRR